MSGRTRPSQALSPEEAARESARVLHEAIKDAKAVKRELDACLEEMIETAKTSVGHYNGLIGEMQRRMDEEAQNAARMFAKMLTDAQTEMLGHATPAALLNDVANVVASRLEPIISAAVETLLPQVINEIIDGEEKTGAKLAVPAWLRP